MEPIALLKALAPGFLPLFAYLGAELVFGETVGLYVGIGLGALEFLVSLAKERRVDFFALAETLLLALMGAISLASGKGIFFRLKPAVTEGLMALCLGALAVLPDSLLREYFGRQIKGIALDQGASTALRKNLLLLIVVLVLHAGLTAWTAVAAGPGLWGFVSGGLLYILLGAVFAFRIAGARRAARGGAPAARAPGRRAARALVSGTRAPGPRIEWRLVLFDEAGRVFASRRGGEAGGPWEDPLSGGAGSLPELEAGIAGGLARLGLGLPGPVAGASAGAGPVLAPRPLFLAGPDGNPLSDPGTPFDPAALFADRPRPAAGPGAVRSSEGGSDPIAVFAAFVPSGLAPRGLDPTLARFFPLGDLAELRGSGLLAPGLERLASSLLALREALRSRAGAP